MVNDSWKKCNAFLGKGHWHSYFIACDVYMQLNLSFHFSPYLYLSLPLFPSLSLSLSPPPHPSSLLHSLGFDIALASSVPSGNFRTCRGELTDHERAVRIRPSDPQFSYEMPNGFVEVYMNGTWGPVCHEGTSMIREADVVCKQLAYPGVLIDGIER